MIHYADIQQVARMPKLIHQTYGMHLGKPACDASKKRQREKKKEEEEEE